MTSKTPKAYSYKRFSKTKQKKGDSLRRQTEDVDPEAIAKELDLPLDDSLDLTDKGRSGWTGEHRTKGALGEFLKLIESDKIASGSVLIIEAWDRLTREALLEAVHLMTGILLKGIGIYTGMDDQYYTKDDFDFGQLVLSAQKLQTGHEESEKKSRRLKSTWEQKRKEARNGGKKLSAVSPRWLEPEWLDPEKKENVIDFKVREEPAEAVREIFKLKRDGFGNTKIAKKLNENESFWQPPKSNRSSGGWRESYIQKIIHNRAVIGEYQPHKKIDGKRESVGDPIKDYYPAVVEEDLFRAVHNQLARYRKKNGHPGGRTGKAKNLFSHIIKCGECGGSMHYIDKGEQQYLRCETSRLVKTDEDENRICEAKAIPYDYFKDRFFEFVGELNISALLPNPDEHQSRIDQLNQTMQANVNRIEELEEQENNLKLQISRTDNPEVSDSLGEELGDLITQRKELIEQNETLSSQLTELSKEAEELKDSRDNIQEFNQLYESTKTKQERKDLRIKMREEIRRLISRIEVTPSEDTAGRFENILIWFHGSEPSGKLISLTEDGWKVLTRRKAPKKTA